MHTYLNTFFKDERFESLKKLADWSEVFWVVDPEPAKIRSQNAQQGYEEKGLGHIDRIISNVGEFLESYFDALYKVNKSGDDDKEAFLCQMHEVFEKNLVLFYTAAHLHDIGMRFPGIFKALSDFVKDKGQNPLHIGGLVHQYHHYASFIILMEMCCLKEFTKIEMKTRPYLANIIDERNNKKNQPVLICLDKLNINLKNIHSKFSEKTSLELPFKEFKVILAILCLLHKDTDEKTLQNILRKFRDGGDNLIEIFNKWWSYFERSKSWTDKVFERFSREKTNELPECDDAELIIAESTKEKAPPSKSIIDLALVEALLQYGDKTEISIARLARIPLAEKGSPPINEMPLKMFIDDTKYDGRKGYINTKMAQRVISDHARARACCFIPVALVTVEKKVNKKKYQSPEEAELNTVIHYLRFPGDENILKYIRYQNEKDFYDLGFFRVMRFHLPSVIYHSSYALRRNPVFSLKFKKKGHHIGDRASLESLFKVFPIEITDGYEIIKLLKSLSRTLKETVKLEEKITEFQNSLNISHTKVSATTINQINKFIVRSVDESELHNDLKNLFKTHTENLISTNLDKQTKALNELRGYAKPEQADIFLADLMDPKKESERLDDFIEKFNLPSTRKSELTELLQTLKNKHYLYKFLKSQPGIPTQDAVDYNVGVLLDLLKQIIEVRSAILVFLEKHKNSGECDRYWKEFLAKYEGPIHNGLEKLGPSTLRIDGLSGLYFLLKSKSLELKKQVKIFIHLPRTLEGIGLLRRVVLRGEGMGKKKFPRKNFPYTKQNRAAINKYAKMLIKPPGEHPVFYESCDSDIPANFEIMAVLNLFFEGR